MSREETKCIAICPSQVTYDTIVTFSYLDLCISSFSKYAIYAIRHSIPPPTSVVYLCFLPLLCRRLLSFLPVRHFLSFRLCLITFYHFISPLHFISRLLFFLWLLTSPFTLCTAFRISLSFFFLLVVFSFLDTSSSILSLSLTLFYASYTLFFIGQNPFLTLYAPCIILQYV